jgi:hypothetical protein
MIFHKLLKFIFQGCSARVAVKYLADTFAQVFFGNSDVAHAFKKFASLSFKILEPEFAVKCSHIPAAGRENNRRQQ